MRTPTTLHLVSEGDDHRVSPLELFFDLVFVYAITQTTQLMADQLSVIGLAQGVMTIAVLWWSWCSFAWLGNTIHVDRGVARLAMFGAMAMMFLVSLTIPEAFTDLTGGLFAPLMFVGAYLAVRLMHLLAYFGAARDNPDLRRVLAKMLLGLLPSVAILAAATGLSGWWQVGAWALALLADYANVYLAGTSGWQVSSPAHFAERFGLIVIIALGESIVAIGIGINSYPMSWLVAATATCGLTLAASMWWAYFDVVARAAEHALARARGEARVKLAIDSYTYLHLPLIAGIVLVALGLKKALLYVSDVEHHSPGEGVHGVAMWALTIGLALYLTALSALRRRNLGRWNRQRLVLAALLLAATPALELLPAAAMVAVVAALLGALITYERLRFATSRAELKHADQAEHGKS